MKVKINEQWLEANENETILAVCLRHGIDIPTLCFHEDQKHKANCRLCVVEVMGSRSLKTACSTVVSDQMVILTDSDKVKSARMINFQLLLANHPLDCENCLKNNFCDLQTMAEKLQIKETPFLKTLSAFSVDESNEAIKRDFNQCIKCTRCLEICKDIQGLHIIEKYGRSNDLKIGLPDKKELNEMQCTYCGQCAAVCPTAAIMEVDHIEKVKSMLADENKYVIVQVAPSIRATICEYFGVDYEMLPVGKLVTMLKEIGFDQVFDTNFTADLTIIEESYELVKRIRENKNLPQFTSCCPGWVNFVENYHPELIPHLSTCKSPQQMFGALAKTYYQEKIDRQDIAVVAIMPCTAKKEEIHREDMKDDVDVVLTTRELERLLAEYDFNIETMASGDFDEPFGLTTGAGSIFGNTGGVMIAALRTAYGILTGMELEKIDFIELTDFDNFKEATININGKEVKVAVIHLLVGAQEMVKRFKENPQEYVFIEVMCCLGGCIGGGGQPDNTTSLRKKRRDILLKIDQNKEIRKSHQNPAIVKLYEEYLQYPLSPTAHKLLHTKYHKK